MADASWEKDDSVRKSSVKKQRDLYLEMKRLENPNFDFIHAKELRSALNAAPLLKKAKLTKSSYQCRTQRIDSLEALFLGVYRGSINLWESGSVINWIARSDGYPSDQHAMQAAVGLAQAAQQWNEVMDGRVRFQYVTNFDDAAFQLRYGGDDDVTFASAFFPDEYEMSLNSVDVFKLQFDPMHRRFMANTMLHELGHVLGLRHEHAHGDPPLRRPEDGPRGFESIIYGERNPRSVMAYYEGQTIQESDIDSIRSAYDELDHGKVISGQGRFRVVQKTIRRVVPNN